MLIKKTKKTWMCFLREVYFLLMGLNSPLSSPTSEQVCQKKGGNLCGRFNRSLLADYGLKGFLTSGSTQTRGLIGLDNEKDAVTLRCLDRKEVRHAIWRVHYHYGPGSRWKHRTSFSDVWQADLRRPDKLLSLG